MIQSIDAALYSTMVTSGAALLEQNKQHINELNVFPVPDGDTGTNMSLTLNAGVTALSSASPDSVSEVADILSGALLRGARGNSGVILSLLFRGMSKALKEHTTICTLDFAAALKEGVAAAYKAVMRPTEGTILTVSRIMAEKAEELSPTCEDFDELLVAILEAGDVALAGTIEQNPVLKKAGVVDAGGEGYILLVRGMLSALRGEPIIASESAGGSARGTFSVFQDEDITFTYCTEFIVNRENPQDPEILRNYLNGVGDSLVFVEDDEIIKVHVHTDIPGKVLTHAQAYGSFVTVKIENMRLQHTEMVNSEAADSTVEPEAPADAAPEKKYGIVSVCAGDGMNEVFRNLGADALVTGGQTMNPSTEDILKAVQTVPAEYVFVLPNNKNIIMAAQQCDALTDKTVIVIPSKTIPQGITALISFDETMEPDELTDALTEACGTVKTALITYAARDSEFDKHHISAGEYLALLEGSLLSNDSDLASLISSVSDAFSPMDPEVITLYYGEDVDEAAAEAIAQKLGADFPDADTSVIYGGQPVYYYMISAE